MTPDELREHCLAKPGAWPDQPWEGDQVAKVGPKIFAFMGAETVGLKCGATREEADEWLARFPDDARCCPTSAGRGGTPCDWTGRSRTRTCVEAVDASYAPWSPSCPRRTAHPAS